MQATNVFHPRLLISTVNTAPRVQCWSFQVLLSHESAPHVEHEKLIWERRSLKTSVCDSHEAVNTDRWSCRGTGQRSYIVLIFGLSNAIFCNESYFIMTDFNDFHWVGSLKVLNISTAVSQEHPVTQQSDHTPTLLLSVSLFLQTFYFHSNWFYVIILLITTEPLRVNHYTSSRCFTSLSGRGGKTCWSSWRSDPVQDVSTFTQW